MDIDHPIETDITELANFLFSQEPKDAGTVQLVQHDDQMDLMFIYEVLITVTMEGLGHLIQSVEDHDHDYDRLDTIHFEALSPWIESLGFSLKVVKHLEKPTGFYCRTIFKGDKDGHYFTMNEIEKEYHFLIASQFSHHQNNFTEISQIRTVIQMPNYWLELSFDLLDDLPEIKQD